MKRTLAIISVLLIALAVRLLFLSSGGVVIDSDEAIVGLMARHILEGRDWPIFYYGQHYMGSLEPTLVSYVFWFMGESEWTLKVIPLIFSLIFVYQIFLLGERLGNFRSGLTAAFFAAVPPVGFVEWSTKARGGFIELVVLGTAGILIAVSIYQQKRPKLTDLCLLAFTLGVAWWVNNQAIFYIASIGLFLIFHLWQTLGFKRLLKYGSISGVCFFIGGAPFWFYNLVFLPRFQTFSQLGGRAEFPNEVIDHLAGFFTEALPILLGARRFWTKADLFPNASLISYILLIVSLLGAIVSCFRKKSGMYKDAGKRGAGIIFVFIAVTPLIFAFSAFGWLTTAPRYLLPLYSVWFVCIAISSFNWGLIIPIGFLSLFFASNYLGGISIPGQPYVANGERVSKDHSELNTWLISNHFSHILTNYWIGYRIAFETKEAVTFSIYSEPFTVRIPRYEHVGEVYEEIAPFILVPTQETEVAEALHELSISYERYIVSGYVVIVPTLPPHLDHDGAVVPITFTKSSSRENWLGRLSDHESGSRWGSGSPQRPGMFVQGEFSAPTKVTRVEIDSGFWITDAARHLSLQLINNEDRCIIYEGATLPLHNFYGPRVDFVSSSNGEPVIATGIRMEEQGKHPIFDWSVAEVNVFTKEQLDKK